MRHCKWDTKYPRIDKEFRCGKPATVEVFELDGKTHQDWLCPEHASQWDTFRLGVNASVGAILNRN